ncbi:invasion associated locus B family protein [Paracoccus sp. JM45]|uniref:invasion associated locus B family protein n=1 Tax=Paracoccus sp. JM45 TaxID=2283626 RepID=UPI000E6B8080|nr:invasion associated locus B family protein [Paracoccus sp. JM45]RJE79811.1 invasion associated locus B family protein [Paracoccus sp. JM45]
MSIKPSHALLATLALIAGPAFAQDTATPAQPETATTEAEAPTPPAANVPAEAAPAADAEPAAPAAEGEATAEEAPGGDADAATQAAAEPAERPGTYYAKSEHGEWTIRCIRAPEGKDPCEMYKLLNDADDNAVAELTLLPLKNGDVAAGATLVAPLETDLIEGLGFRVDSGKMQGYPFSFCAPVGCISRMGFTTAELNAMKRGSKANVQLLPFGGDPKKPVQLEISLSGFTAAFDELAAYAAAPAPEAEPAEDAPAE